MKIHTIDLVFQGIRHSIAAFAIELPAGGIVLVECGPYSTHDALLSGLADAGFLPDDVQAVLLSHIHFDHAGAAWWWAARGATVYVHPVGAPHLGAPDKLYNSARQIYGEQMDRLWGRMEGIEANRLNTPSHGAVIELGGLQWTAWHTPGHATHHIAWECEDVLFTGDVAGVRVSARYPVMPPCPPPDIDVEAWLSSIELLEARPAGRLMLTHFGEIDDKQVHFNELKKRLRAWADWMRPHYEAQTPVQDIIPEFEAWVRADLVHAGVPDEDIARYDAANPAFMSVAGLLRYWKKRLSTPI
jgi:glyoxylase-like metal-dependent hydrolase (beta-lactamase superfamily II)